MEEEIATHSSTLAWAIPWTQDSPWGHEESDTPEHSTEQRSAERLNTLTRDHGCTEQVLWCWTLVLCPLRRCLSFPSSAHISPPCPLVFNSLDMSRSVSVTTAGQCRLAPLIQVILDCSHLYDYAVKLLFKLRSCEYSGLDLWKLLAARPSLERGSSPCPGALGFLLRFQKARGAPSCVDNKRWGPSLAVRRDAPSLP